MSGMAVVFGSIGLISATLTGASPPVDPCAGSVAVAHHHDFSATWCGKASPESFVRFEKAWADYEKYTLTALKSELSIYDELFRSCGDWGAGFQPADPWAVVQAASRLEAETRPAIDAANEARNEMLATVDKAFGGSRKHVKTHLKLTGSYIEILGRARMNIDTAGDAFITAQSEESCNQAQNLLQTSVETAEFTEQAGELQFMIMKEIDQDLMAMKRICSNIRVVAEMSAAEIEKRSDSDTARTKKSGGASLLFPSTLDVGRKAVKLPLTVRSKVPGSATISVTRAGKGIVATAGDASAGGFGLLMTIPSGTKPGKATITYRLSSGGSPVVLKGVVRLI
jgi:hypothetical protein